MPDPVNIENPSPEDLARMKHILQQRGELRDGMSQREISDRMTQILEWASPPKIPAGRGPISAYSYLADVLSRNGTITQPEDPDQRADLADGGPSIRLEVLAILAMRHFGPGDGQPLPNFSDERLLQDLAETVGHDPVTQQDIDRAQAKLDEVAADQGIEAKPWPRWWEKPRD